MEFKILKTLNELIEIESDYNDLLSRINDRQVFYEFAWLKNYILYYPDSYAKDGGLCIVAGYQNKQLLILCPFCMRKEILSFICEEATDYSTILIDKSQNIYSVLKDMFDYISKNTAFNKLCLKNFRQSDVLLNSHILLNNTGKYKAFVNFTATAPYSLIQTENYKFVKKQVNDIRRRQRILAEKQNVSFEDTEKLSEDDLEFITKQKDASFGENIFTGQKSWKFFTELNKDIPEHFIVHRMFIDGKLVAIHFGFQSADTISYFIPCYDANFKGAGQILLLHIIEKAMADGKKCFDSLRGEESYKFHFCDRIASNFILTAFPLTKANKLRLFCYRAGRFVLGKVLLGGSV